MPRSALVVGGGPAGASAALGLARSGLEVTLVEQRTTWRGRICGGFLCPEAVGELEKLGLLDRIRDAGATGIENVSVTFPSGSPIAVDVRRGGQAGLMVDRRALEEALLDAVREAGITVEMGTTASAIHGDGDRWVVSLRDARDRTSRRRFTLVVLADGCYTLARDAATKPRRGWFGWSASFSGVRQNPGTLTLHAFPGGYVGLQTCSGEVTSVSGVTWHSRGQTRPWQAEFDEVLERSKPLRNALYGSTRAEEWRGGGPVPFRHHLRWTGGPVAVGDAAAVSDPFTGDGLARALSAGSMLARSIAEAGSPASAVVGRAHAKLWNARYSKRLSGGRWIRELLKAAPVFKASEVFLFRRSSFLENLAATFLVAPDRAPLPPPAPARAAVAHAAAGAARPAAGPLPGSSPELGIS